MAEFKWDEDAPDPLDGFDTDPEPEPQPVVASNPAPAYKQKPQLPKVAPKPNKVAEVIEELEDSPDPAELTEAEWRLEKAGFYRAVINSQLLSSDHPAAVEVEEELQEWARGQLETLLGIRTPAGIPTAKVVYESPFNAEEIDILRALAVRALGRQNAPAPTPAPAQNKNPTPVAIQPATAKMQPTVRAVEANREEVRRTEKRGRGRPRKNPCRICGQMECEHKRTAPVPQAQQAAPAKAAQRPQPKPSAAPVSGETYDGVPIQVMDDGTKFIETKDGRKYKLDLRQMTHKETGEVRMAYVPIELSQIVKPPSAKPYPSDAEAMQLASMEADKNSGAMARLTASTGAAGVPMRFSGADLVKAAMAAPERESYIPEPPPRKR